MKTTVGWDVGMKSDPVVLETKVVISSSTEVFKVESVLLKSIGKVSVEPDSLVGTCVGVSGGAICSGMDGMSSSSLRRRVVGTPS